jgi:hypothetical protein
MYVCMYLCMLNDKMINIIHIYVLYVNIKVCIYRIVLKENINIPQIYLYNINIYFRLGSDEFRVEFDNIYTLFIIHQVQKILTHSDWVRLDSVGFILNFHP